MDSVPGKPKIDLKKKKNARHVLNERGLNERGVRDRKKRTVLRKRSRRCFFEGGKKMRE